jgi:type II secretory pathway component PulF
VLVLAAALGLSLFLIWLNTRLILPAMAELVGTGGGPVAVPVMLWLPPLWLTAAGILVALALARPAWRSWLGWRLPGFLESNLAQFAAAMHLLLERGGNLAESVALVRDLERGSPAGRELEGWHARIASGQGRVAQFTAGARVFPPLFLWLLEQGGDDLARGFRRAAEIYFQRARHRTEMLLYAALPVAVIALGALILVQVGSGMVVLTQFLNALGSLD